MRKALSTSYSLSCPIKALFFKTIQPWLKGNGKCYLAFDDVIVLA
jgi:hypothetical protein